MPNPQEDINSAPAQDSLKPLECFPDLDKQLQEVEELTFDLKKLLVRFENTLVQEGIRQQIEVLERWVESYRRGLTAAHKISQKGLGWLVELRDQLKLSADEILRLEAEGGNPITKEQAAKAEALLRARQSIDKVIPVMEHVFHSEGVKSEKDQHINT